MTANSKSLIILAGGKGERAGMPKGLLTFEGRSLLAMQMERALGMGFPTVILGLGFSAERYEEEVRRLALPPQRLILAISSEPELGPFRTLQEALRKSAGDVFVLPIDTPLPDKAVIEALRGQGKAALPEIGGRGGHPVWLSRSFAQHLLAISPRDEDARLDRQLHQLGKECARIPVQDARIRMNVNTREEWEKSAAYFTKAEAVRLPEES